jgi:hypothetical protein
VSGVDLTGSALALHAVLLRRHWRGDGVVGPDMGIRLNYRLGRFVKSYLPMMPWRDDLYYQQAQAYWTLANWRLLELTDHADFARLATAAARGVLARQRPDGAWDYPNPEWRGRVATTEGTWASIALVEAYRRTGEAAMLEAALGWHRFLEERIGFQRALGGLAFNYFAGRAAAPVANNSADVLRLLAELADATGTDRFLDRAPELLTFLAAAQRPSGELPYQVSLDGKPVRLPHYQCPQYNAFECLDLVRYEHLTGDRSVRPIVAGLRRFLERELGADGEVPYACHARTPHVTYHLAAVAAALHEAAPVVGRTSTHDTPVVRRLLALQRPDGSFPHSRRDYGLLRDDRSYPRTLTMILRHLLLLADRPVAPQAHDAAREPHGNHR